MKQATIVLAVFFVSAPLNGQEKRELASEQVLAAIDLFGAEPLSESGTAMSGVIVLYADKSEDLKVTLDAKLQSWLVSRPRVKYAEQLMVAFVAGNARSQIETGVFKNDSYSGMLFLFRVYSQIKRQDKAFKIPHIEELIAVHRKGELHDYITRHTTQPDASVNP